MDIIQTFSPLVSVVVAILAVGWWTYRLNRDLRLELQNSHRELRLDLQKDLESNQEAMRSLVANHIHSTETNEVHFRLLVGR